MSSLESFLREKILSPDSLAFRLEKERNSGKTLATLNGSFDLLHAGHLYILFEASKQADLLLVAVNSDASVQAYKDPRRPIIPLQSRMEMLAALDFVDFVTWFDETDPRALLTKVAPDVHVNGQEYGEKCIEAATVREKGGRIHLVGRIPGLATSEIIQKIQLLEATCV
ncbi:MAG: Bifunctional protein HldE [Chlamydiae bacterium]|nr:Bifunctional protein HldE [Chlamydiota bacterium]